MKGNIWIPGILEVFCLQTLESGILGFGIQYSAQRIPSSDWNPQSTFHWQGIQNLVPGVHNPQHGIQNPRLSWITLHGAMVPLPSWGGGDLYPLIYRVCTLF